MELLAVKAPARQAPGERGRRRGPWHETCPPRGQGRAYVKGNDGTMSKQLLDQKPYNELQTSCRPSDCWAGCHLRAHALVRCASSSASLSFAVASAGGPRRAGSPPSRAGCAPLPAARPPAVGESEFADRLATLCAGMHAYVRVRRVHVSTSYVHTSCS